MPAQRPITIIGGGLAGLSLGTALARAGVKVTLCEAGLLPRPRVCGEFISGLKAETVAGLGLEQPLRGAVPNRTTGWHAGGRLRWSAQLPEPALGLSRPVIESRLLDEFVSAGGELRLNTRIAPTEESKHAAGHVWTAGRRADATSPWLGLKIHCRDFPAGHDLEVHLGRGGYVGVARIEDGKVNICGLFRARPELRGPREALLPAYAAACGLHQLVERIAAGAPDPASAAAVSGLDFTHTWREDGLVSLGDHLAAIPPYTGHGMALALENAASALDPLLAYANGSIEWPATARAVRHAVAAQQDSRLRWARRLHPWLLQPLRQSLLIALANTRLLPFRFFYIATHGPIAAAA